MIRLLSAFALAVVAVAIVPALAQTQKIGDWEIKSFRTPQNEFMACRAIQRTKLPVDFGLVIDNQDQWHGMLLASEKNRWPDGRRVDLVWQFDNQARRQATAEPKSNGMMFWLGVGAEATREFASARAINVTVAKVPHQVALTQIETVVRELRDCATTEKALAPAVPPGSGVLPKTGTFEDKVFVGRWTVEIYRDKGGQFGFCEARQTVRQDVTHGLILDYTGGWSMSVRDRQASNPVDRVFRFDYSVDGLPRRSGQARNLTAKTTDFDIGDTQQAIDELRKGRQLVILIDNREAIFDLEGAGPAITAVENCFKAATGNNAASRPAPPRPTSQSLAPLLLPVETPSSQR